MTANVRRVALIAWAVLGAFTAAAVLAGSFFSGWLSVLLLLPALLAWGVLLVVHHRWSARWRIVLLSWLTFGLLRGAVAWLGAQSGMLAGFAAQLSVILCMYAWLAGYAALITLVCHRDVSIAYIFLPTAIGALAMLLTVRSAGGVEQWFTALTSATTMRRAVVFEPLMLSLSCMGTLGVIALLPHMFITVVREMRGN